jgi:hypothetical protein
MLPALREPPPCVVSQLGHTDPTITLRFYAKVMLRRTVKRSGSSGS